MNEATTIPTTTAISIGARAAPSHLVVLLHGVGADAASFEGVARVMPVGEAASAASALEARGARDDADLPRAGAPGRGPGAARSEGVSGRARRALKESTMPIIDVSLLAGRSMETKKALIRELTEAAERVLGVRRDSIRVLLREVPAEHWGVAGQTLDEPRAKDGDGS